MSTALSAKFVTKNPVERANGLFVASEEEAKKVAKPFTSMLARRGAGAGAGNSDFVDIFAIVVALADFVGTNMEKRMEIRTVMQQNVGGEVDRSDPGSSGAVSPGVISDSLNSEPGGGI